MKTRPETVDADFERLVRGYQERGYRVTEAAPHLFDIVQLQYDPETREDTTKRIGILSLSDQE